MKLSKAQEDVLNRAKQEIDKARACKDFADYYEKYEKLFIKYDTVEDFKNGSPEYYENVKRGYEKQVDGIAGVHCNTRTIKKLEELGLIEILYDSTGSAVGLDEIKVLNY